jgi:hypothetical protein
VVAAAAAAAAAQPEVGIKLYRRAHTTRQHAHTPKPPKLMPTAQIETAVAVAIVLLHFILVLLYLYCLYYLLGAFTIIMYYRSPNHFILACRFLFWLLR